MHHLQCCPCWWVQWHCFSTLVHFSDEDMLWGCVESQPNCVTQHSSKNKPLQCCTPVPGGSSGLVCKLQRVSGFDSICLWQDCSPGLLSENLLSQAKCPYTGQWPLPIPPVLNSDIFPAPILPSIDPSCADLTCSGMSTQSVEGYLCI